LQCIDAVFFVHGLCLYVVAMVGVVARAVFGYCGALFAIGESAEAGYPFWLSIAVV
jgi:hypothetical protein